MPEPIFSTEKLQQEFEQELEKTIQRVRQVHQAIPASERDRRPETTLSIMEQKARRSLEGRFQRLSSVEELRQTIATGTTREQFPGEAQSLLRWKEQEATLIREEMVLEGAIRGREQFMETIGAPTVLTKAAQFFYKNISPLRNIPDYRASGLYKKALTQYNTFVDRLDEIIVEKTRAMTYQSLYEGLAAYIVQGKVTSFDDLFTLTKDDGTPITRFQEMGEDDEELRKIFNKIVVATLSLSEEVPVEELNYDSIIAELAKKPKFPPGTGIRLISSMTTEELVKHLQRPKKADPKLPSSVVTVDRALEVYKRAGVPDETIARLEGLEAYTKRLEDYWEAISNNQEQVKKGLKEARMPEMGVKAVLLQTISQPALTALDVFGKLYSEWIAPWGGFLYRSKAEGWEEWKPQYMLPAEKEFLTTYREALATDDWWHAGGQAFAETELGFWDRLAYEWIADPLTWIGTSLPTKAATALPVIGKFLGPIVGIAEKGWLKGWDVLIFDRIKNVGKAFSKTPTQASINYASEDMVAVANYITARSNGRHYRHVPLEDSISWLKEARSWGIHHPEDGGIMARAGRAVLRTESINESTVKGISKRLGTEFEVTKDTVLSVSSITNDVINNVGIGLLTRKTGAPFLLRTLGIHETKTSLKSAGMEINKLFRQGIANSDNLMSKAKNTPDLLSNIFEQSRNTYFNTVKSAAAHNLEMSGRVSAMFSKVTWSTMTVWRNTIDKWMVAAPARAYLAFSAYGPGNIAEGILKPVMAAKMPFWRFWGKDAPLTVVNPTARMQRMTVGLSIPPELQMGIPRIEMATETPTFKGIGAMSKNLRRWRSILSAGPIGRFFIDLPGSIGIHQRTNYYRQMFTGFLGEDAPELMAGLSRTIDDAVTVLPDDFVRSLNMSRKELKDEMLERSIAGPASTRSLLDDIVSDRIALEKNVSRDTAMADRISGGRVAEAISKHPLVPGQFGDDLVTKASNGSLWKNLGKSIDDSVDGYKAGMYDYFVHSPEFYKTRMTERVNEIMSLEIRNKEEFSSVMQELRDLQRFYTDSTDDIIRAMNELETEMSSKMKWTDWNEWRGVYTKEVYEGMEDYGKVSLDNFDKLVKKLRTDVGKHLNDVEQTSVNQLFDLWVGEQKFLKSFWTKRRADEVAEIAAMPPKGQPRSEAWKKFRDNQDKAHAKRREQQAPFRLKSQVQESLTSSVLGTAGPPPPLLDVAGRKLTKVDVATLFHGHSSQLGASMLRVETMTLKSRQDFILEVRAQAELMARQVEKSPESLGWTDEGIGEVYDYVLRDMQMSPQAASVMEPHLMELQSLRHELWSIYNTKALPEGTADELSTWLSKLADDLDNVPGYATPRVTEKVQVARAKEEVSDLGLGEITSPAGGTIRSQPEIDAIRDRVISLAQDVKVELPKNLVGKFGEHAPFRTVNLEFIARGWFRKSDTPQGNDILQLWGRTAQDNKEYLRGIHKELRDKYPSGFIRLFRGSGASKSRGKDPLAREFTNATSSRATAKSFEDTWDVAVHLEDFVPTTTEQVEIEKLTKVFNAQGFESGISQAKAKIEVLDKRLVGEQVPSVNDVLVRVEDVVAIASVDESELIIPTRLLRQRIENPIVPHPTITEALLPRELSPEFRATKQQSADKASVEYFKDWADYTNENSTTAFMRTMYPFWTYELHRLFWLPRASIRTPGVFKGWGTYMDNTEDGYVHIPGTSMEFNLLRGTIFMGGMIRLIKRDYPEYYDQFPGLSEYFDWYSRFGFYPATYINFLKTMGGTSVNGQPNFGELLPAWFKTPLNLYIAAQPDSTAAKFLLDKVIPEPFRTYTTVQMANKIAQLEKKTFNGMDVQDKIRENEPLTPEEEELWTKAVQFNGWQGAIQEQSGIIRIKTEEQLDMWEAAGDLIEEITGYTKEEQFWMRRHGFRIGDYAQLDILDQQVISELEGMKYHQGIFTTLMPTAWQEEDRRRREFFRTVRDFGDELLLEQEELNRQVRAGEINMRQWSKSRSDLRGRHANFFTDLSERERYKNVALEMDDVVRKDGTIREGLVSRAEKRGMIPPIEHPSRELLNAYFSIKLEKGFDANGNLTEDWDKYFLEIDTIVETLRGVEEEDFIQVITKSMTDLEKLRWEVSRRYFRGYNRRQQAILGTQYNEEEQSLIKQWILGTPAERDILQEVLIEGTDTKLIASYTTAVSQTGQNLRKLSPELDAWLQFFEQTDSTLTDAAGLLYIEFRNSWGIPP